MSKRKGFTLVELLIVVAIIGILVSLLTLSSAGSLGRAKANTVAANLRAIKSAAMVYYVENLKSFDPGTTTPVSSKDIFATMGVSLDIVKDNWSYDVVATGTNNKIWYAKFYGVEDDFKGELEKLAKKVGLLKADASGYYVSTDKSAVVLPIKYE